MADLPAWVSQITDVISRVARLTGNVESLTDRVVELQDKLDKAEQRIGALEADLRVARAELKGEAQVAAVNTVIQAHEQMIDRIQKVEAAMLPKPDPDNEA